MYSTIKKKACTQTQFTWVAGLLISVEKALHNRGSETNQNHGRQTFPSIPCMHPDLMSATKPKVFSYS